MSNTPHDLFERLREAESLVLLLDYDGTLVPFAATPDAAVPDATLCNLLRSLAMRPRTHTHLVSGRDRGSLERWLGDLSIGMHAEHGYWTRMSGARSWSCTAEIEPGHVATVLAAMLRITEAVGGRVERKHAGIAWHYRGEPIDADVVAGVHDLLRRAVVDLGFEVLAGECVLEVRRRGIHKGLIAERVREWHGSSVTIAAFGDDHTDEDLFKALPPGSISVKVGWRESVATHRVADHASVRALLADLL
jgi:trehalose 6-phosphate synthase/phosphatase